MSRVAEKFLRSKKFKQALRLHVQAAVLEELKKDFWTDCFSPEADALIEQAVQRRLASL